MDTAEPPAPVDDHEAVPGHTRIERTSRRRRPSGRPPPLPHPLQTTGVSWMVASVVLVALSLVVFAGVLSGPAVAVTAVDDAVVRWIAGVDCRRR